MVAGFAYVGISATDAVFLSVTLGATMTLVGLLGGLVWMLTSAKKISAVVGKTNRILSP